MSANIPSRRPLPKASTLAIALGVSVLLGACGGPGSTQSKTAVSCGPDHWVSAWQSPPSDATATEDASLTPLAAGPAQTFRLIFSPLGHGSTVRLHLSNRYGQAPVVFDAVRIAHRSLSAAVDPSTSVPVLFSGQATVTIPAGADLVSDPLVFAFEDLDDLAVSIAAADPGAVPTHHFTARQTSYATVPGAGDHSADASAAAFSQATTSRPFMAGLDTLAPATTSTVVALGDSLTDGFQGPPSVVPEDTASLNRNERYPDDLRRALMTAGRQVFVSNAGIGGNRVLQDGMIPQFAPSALNRLQPDVLAQSGVTDVILAEGLNDIGQTPGLTAQQLTDGYIALINILHQHGLRVILATLTPAGNNNQPSYSGPEANALRNQVNSWIRTSSPADAIVDFDTAVRDAANPAVIAAAYDGGDGIHLNAAGYARIAQTITPDLLPAPSCAAP